MKYLQYVQPTGNRQTYSNTNIYIDHPNFSFYFEYLFYEQTISSGDWSELLGTGYPNKFRVGTESNGTKSVFIMFGNTKASYNGTIEGEVYIDKERMMVNWEDVITIQNPASSLGAGYLTIGGDNQYPGDALINGNIKIGKLHITDNDSGNEVACLVPAIDDASSDEVVGFYDETNDVFYTSDGTAPWIAGPEILSIGTDPTSAVVDATGDTINIYVGTENSWVANPTGGTWWSLSDTGGTGEADITLTVSANTASSTRQDAITFIDTNTTDEVVFSINQNGVRPAGGQPFYFGGVEIYEAYIGETALTEAYVGEELVFAEGAYTFVVNTLLGAAVGQYWEFAMADQQGNFSALYTSTWDDVNQEAVNSLNVSQGFTWSLTTDPNDGTNTLTISGPFDPNEYYDVHFYGTDSVQGSCWSADNWDGVEFTADTITISSNYEGDLDQECECTAQGGVWDGSECIFPESSSSSGSEEGCNGDPECECYEMGWVWDGANCNPPDPCGGDPECECTAQGGWWDGSECHYEEPSESEG